MKINQQISNRFEELASMAAQIRMKHDQEYGDSIDDAEAFQTWASSALHLVAAVFGEDSPHYRNLSLQYGKYNGWAPEFLSMRGIFLAAKSDYAGGYLFNLEATISGEIFADFVVLAKNALANNQKDVAAVLACAALEDALKRYATLRD